MMSLKPSSLLCLIFLLMIPALGNEWSVKYSQLNLCALKGSTVIMNVTYTHPPRLTVTKRFWLINPVQGKESTDLNNVPGYSGRVTYITDVQNHFHLRLSDVKKTDEQMYYFRIRTNTAGQRYQGDPGVTLSVTDLDLQIAPAEVTEGQSVVLTCKTTCSLTDPTFIWYKNSRDLTTKTNKNNKVRLQSVSSADAGSYSCAVRGYEHLHSPVQTLSVRSLGNKWSVKYSQLNLCALKGSTVIMNVTYTHPPRLTVTQRFWVINPVKGKVPTDLCNEPGYSGRVTYITDVQNHFPLSLSDVKKTDEQMYCFRIITNKKGQRYQGDPGVTLSVTGLDLQIAPAEVTEGQSVVLTCKTTCSLTDPTFIWYKNSRDLTTKTNKNNEVRLQSVSSEDAGSYSCAVRGYEHLHSPVQTLRVRYHPKNVSVSISPSGEIVEDSSVTLTCNSDANPPVQNYTWFKGKTSVGNEKTYNISKISSEDSGEYKCKCSNEVGHQDSNSVTLNVLYPPKNVSVSISPSGEMEDSSVTLTCSSDANPPVQSYTWFKEKESSPVGSGQSYRAVQSGQYYCEAQNKHGSERSAAVSVTINAGTVIVYVAVGLGLFGLAALLSALFWLRSKRQKKKVDEGDNQNTGPSAKDDTYAALDSTGRAADDVYHTLAISHPSPRADASTSSDY
ncbi:sialoadhesin-like isoform X6 [Tachysurus fulvidraco]|uniref:sialoadhesin-like isoform X6 n=1 Tax=Tachysurus fulvidraco TaxID=1234273 RepID=UPI001FEFC347|nr:sialoadhesin-like isoform X6 [Tachysurus fulvidraco]